jgi:hypothetical protein
VAVRLAGTRDAERLSGAAPAPTRSSARAGNDTLSGGAGADRFVFPDASGAQGIILDFVAART